MLRVNIEQAASDRVVIRLEGSVSGPWASELALVARPILDEARNRGNIVELHLHDVVFLDTAGVQVVRSLLAAGARLAGASQFIDDLLAGDA